MKLEQLRYFLEAARLQHVGRAGKALHISPSAISFAIAALEQELETSLFDRVGTRVALSEAGQRLKSRVEMLFDSVDQIRAEFSAGSRAAFYGDFRVSGSHFLAVHHLNGCWNTFQKEHPKLIGQLCPDRTADVLRAVLAGTADMGLCFSPQQHADLVTQEIYRGRLIPVVRKRHPILKLAGKPDRILRELSKYPAMIHKAVPGVDFCEDHPEFVKRGIQCRITNYFESDDLAAETISRTTSWSLLPDLVVRHHGARLHGLAVPKDWSAAYSVSVVFRKTRKDSPVIGAFTRVLEKSFQYGKDFGKRTLK